MCTSVPGTDGLTYAYDGANHLLGEYALDGTPITEYVWFGDLPVAIIKGTGAGTQVFAVYSDHLNTPRVITDADGQVRWRWMGEPFGASAAEEQPTAGLNTLEQNLRFPGQQYEKFGGRHFNHFRDYDPSVGRYIQSDPVGLAGGLNTYIYVHGNPLNRIDPTGLWATPAHNAILRDAFPGATPEMLEALQAGSERADSVLLGYQGPDYAHMHAMTSDSLDSHQSCKKLNDFFAKYLALYQSNLKSANYWSARGNNAMANLAIRDAYFALGFALHPIMDNTSPAHSGFQKWSNSDAPRHGVFSTSIENVNGLTPALIKKTIHDIHQAMATGVGIKCDCLD